ALVDEFVGAVQQRWPNCIIQFEDFGNTNAFRFLEKYRDTGPVFNDDMQGTGSVAYAGTLGALRITGQALKDQRIVFLGAGEAAIGIAKAMIQGMLEEGLSEEEAHQRFWLVDSKGLVTLDRLDSLVAHKKAFARDEPPAASLLEVVLRVEPTILLGVSGQPGKFTQEVISSMAAAVDRPVIFALSNPTSKAECTAEDAYRWSNGQAIFASGSPFDPVDYNGRTFVPGQGNNVYIFPGVGLGVIISGAKRITDSMFHVAAKILAAAVPDSMLDTGSVFPPMDELQTVSHLIGAAVAQEAYRLNLNSLPQPDDVPAAIADFIWKPEYKPLL
ncbi:MAG: oxaloacetate-decarboxylating malate dehydrogenase, partial [Candidatus Marinimicrobia bacterium]|nr:oxaloacetate-decarboxylating malate dehydrogenase [Candidatus Neomarinimicrobiota bacterium]